MWHPLNLLSESAQWWLLILLSFPGLLFLFRQEGLARGLRTSTAQLGLVSLEMSLSSPRSCQIIDSWSEESRERARRHVCADYIFIAVYTTVLALVTLWASRRFSTVGAQRLATVVGALAWLPWIIGLFEFASNSAMLRMLSIYPDIPGRLSRFAGSTARLKLGLILVALVIAVLMSLTPKGPW